MDTGMDIPKREQLIAYNRTQEEVRGVIGADSLAYLKMERLGQIVEDLPVCNGCFTGKYPVDPPTEDIRGEYER
jgi:amidophosphoribosyltransferase